MEARFKSARDLIVVAGVIAAAFLFFYGGCLKRGVPLAYEGDSFPVMLGIKAFSTGEINMFLPMHLHQLNAPFAGAWSDFPTEKLSSGMAGMMIRVFGMATGTSLAVLLLQMMAGVCFYGCGRFFRTDGRSHALLVTCSILFGLAPYAFIRNLQHLTLTAYWHLPLLVLTLLWYGWPERTKFNAKNGLIFGCVSSFIAGNLNPYYLGPFFFLLSIFSLGALAAKNWNRIPLFIAIIASGMAGFLVQNIGTFLYAIRHGHNPVAVSRNLWWMVKFGLYLPDLFFPRAHQNELISKFSWSLYHSHVPPQLWGESQTAYIGMVSGMALIAMIFLGVAWIGAKKFERISPLFWLSTGLILFAVAGGVNYILGAFGFLLLRSTGRASIMLSCMALYFLCDEVSPRLPRRWLILLSVILLGLGIWDQLPRYPAWEEAIRQRAWNDYQSDERFFREMEEKLPRAGMVFELPVKDYPESGPIREMGDYEHFRPALHTQQLRFSYGTIKGRGDTNWQKTIATETTSRMVEVLERYGFCSILVNRKAYEDRAEILRRNLLEAGAVLIMENQDFLIFKIQSSEHPEFPNRN